MRQQDQQSVPSLLNSLSPQRAIDDQTQECPLRDTHHLSPFYRRQLTVSNAKRLVFRLGVQD